MVKNATVDARVGNDEDWRLASVGKRAFDLIPRRWVDRPKIILEFRTPKCVMLKFQLGVTKYQGTTALTDEVDHRAKRWLF
jgi:hypothetical protein